MEVKVVLYLQSNGAIHGIIIWKREGKRMVQKALRFRKRNQERAYAT